MGFLDKLFGGLFGNKGKQENKKEQKNPEENKNTSNRHGGVRQSNSPKNESTKAIQPAEKINPPEPKKEEPIHQFFDFEMPDEVPANDFEFYKTYIKAINKEYNLMEDLEVEFSKDKGLRLYNHETDDLVMKVSSTDSNFTMRKNSYIQRTHSKFDEYYIRNLGIVSLIFNRYLIEKDSKEKILATSFENENGKQVVRTYLTTKNSGIKERMLSQGEFFGVNIKSEKVEERLKHYEALGIFKNLDDVTIEKGKALSRSYNLLTPHDALWYFKNLITDCCPRESSGNEFELKKFINISNNNLTYTNFEETNIDGKLNVKCEINGKSFTSNNLPNFFSLRFIQDLNGFLMENFGSSFYVWNWERNPWEQQTFIYFTKEQLESFKGYSKEFSPLENHIVEFYENN